MNITTGKLISISTMYASLNDSTTLYDYEQFYASPEVMAVYNKVLETTCMGDYVKSSIPSSSTPTDTEAANSTNENEGMLNDGSGANTGVEGRSSASITWGVSSFVVLAITAGLSTILFE